MIQQFTHEFNLLSIQLFHHSSRHSIAFIRPWNIIFLLSIHLSRKSILSIFRIKMVFPCTSQQLLNSFVFSWPMHWKWTSRPKSFLTLCARDGNPFKVLSFNMIPQVVFLCLFSSQCTFVQGVSTCTCTWSFFHHWNHLDVALFRVTGIIACQCYCCQPCVIITGIFLANIGLQI